MKKMISAALVICLLLSLAACGAAPAVEPTPEPTPEPTAEPTPEPKPVLKTGDFVGVYIGAHGMGLCLKSDGSAILYNTSRYSSDENCTWSYSNKELMLTVKIPSYGYSIYAYTDDGNVSLKFMSQNRSWINEVFQKQNLDSESISYDDYVRLINVLCKPDNSSTHEYSIGGFTFAVPDYYGDPSSLDGKTDIYSDWRKGGIGYAEINFSVLDDGIWYTPEEWETMLDDLEAEDELFMSSEANRSFVTDHFRYKNDNISYSYIQLEMPGDDIFLAYAWLYNTKNHCQLDISLVCYEAYFEGYLAHFIEMLNTGTT